MYSVRIVCEILVFRFLQAGFQVCRLRLIMQQQLCLVSLNHKHIQYISAEQRNIYLRTCTIHVWHPLWSWMSEDQQPPRPEVRERVVHPLKKAPFPRRLSSGGTIFAHSSVVDAAETPDDVTALRYGGPVFVMY